MTPEEQISREKYLRGLEEKHLKLTEANQARQQAELDALEAEAEAASKRLSSNLIDGRFFSEEDKRRWERNNP